MKGSSLSLFHALASLFIFPHLTTCLATPPFPTKSNTTEYIKESCNATMYPNLCYKSLSTYAQKIQTSPKRLANSALSVTLSATRSTSLIIKNLSRSATLKPRETSAILDCVQELSDSLDELRKSIIKMGHSHRRSSNFEVQMSDVQTWVSAALTNDDTCMDGFAGKAMDGEAKTVVRRHTVKVVQLTSIALAFINKYAAGLLTTTERIMVSV